MAKKREETVEMKEKLKNSPWLRRLIYTQAPLTITRPALRETLCCIGLLAGGFVLSCGSVSGAPLPLALALMAATGGGIRGLCCLIGGAAGYLTMQPFPLGLEMTSAGVLVYVCLYIFSTLWVQKRQWFRCAACGVMTGTVGMIFLLSQGITVLAAARFARNVALAALMPLGYEQLLRGRRTAGSLAGLCSFLVGLAAIPLPLGLRAGVLLGSALAAAGARRCDPGDAAALGMGCGLALDLAGGQALWTFVLGGAGLIGAASTRKWSLMRLAVFGAAALAGLGFLARSGYQGYLSVSLGLLLSLAVPGGLLEGRRGPAAERTAQMVADRLQGGQRVLLRLYEAVGVDPRSREEQELGRVFDKAAAKVCRRCSRYGECWEKNAAETYELLQPMLPRLQGRRAVDREDFPRGFSDSCRQMDGFALAVSQELERLQGRDLDAYRRQEDRILVSRFSLELSRMLERNARALRSDRNVPQEAFSARLGVSARGRDGSRRSGDRGTSFRTEDGMFYVCLCDGAGTGDPAARESLLAVDTLTELIQAGMPAPDAMELLNGMYVLRDSGSFSTMDVLELSLLTGRGALYKWGAAPSYLKTASGVRRLGTPAPPPGLEARGDQGVQIIDLALWSGELLVMVSDGAAGEDTQLLLEEWQGDNVKALARTLVEEAALRGSMDDMTAAVVRVTALNPGR